MQPLLQRYQSQLDKHFQIPDVDQIQQHTEILQVRCNGAIDICKKFLVDARDKRCEMDKLSYQGLIKENRRVGKENERLKTEIKIKERNTCFIKPQVQSTLKRSTSRTHLSLTEAKQDLERQAKLIDSLNEKLKATEQTNLQLKSQHSLKIRDLSQLLDSLTNKVKDLQGQKRALESENTALKALNMEDQFNQLIKERDDAKFRLEQTEVQARGLKQCLMSDQRYEELKQAIVQLSSIIISKDYSVMPNLPFEQREFFKGLVALDCEVKELKEGLLRRSKF